MLVDVFNRAMYSSIFISLLLIDFFLGNGFVDMFKKIFCKITCFVKRTIREEARLAKETEIQSPVNVPILFTEILLLTFTIAMLHKYKQFRSKDRIDELLQESKDALRQTNEFLEKWRLRRVPTEYSYLDEEPQEVKPLTLEVPILHMAIIDTLGTTRSQPERGDAGDTINITDSTLLSVTSLLDDDLDSNPERPSDGIENRDIEFNKRCLWEVVEEDANDFEI